MKQRITSIYILLCLSFAILQGQTKPLSLSEAIALSLEKNYDLIISQYDLEAAMINNNWGNAGRLPSVGFDASATYTYYLNDSYLQDRYTAGISANWLLFDGFRVQYTKDFLESTEQLASGQLEVLVENTIQDVILAYYTILLEKEQLEVLKNVMDLSKDRYEYEQKKKSLGGSGTYEVLQAENVFLSDKASFVEQEMQVRTSVRNLNFIMGMDPGSGWDLTEAFTADTSHYVLAEMQEKMLSNNQALANQYVNLQLQKETIKIRQADFFPSLSFRTGMDNTISRSGNTSVTSKAFNPYAGVVLSYDIYNGGLRKRALEVARIEESVRQTGIEQIKHSLVNELHSLYDYHEVRISLLGVAESSLEASKLNLEMSAEKYRSGAINSFNYRDVQLMYLEASFRKLQAIYNLIDSNTRLSRITGAFLKYEEEK